MAQVAHLQASSDINSDIGKGNPLWEFATWTYELPGVQKALLALQDRMGADVNMVLFCVWLAYRGSNGNDLAQNLSEALKLSRDWQAAMVQPIRKCRDNLKVLLDGDGFTGATRGATEALRERIKAAELDLEALQIVTLCALVDDGSKDFGAPVDIARQKEDAQNNLNVYFTACGISLDPLAQSHVLRVINNVFK